MKIYLVIKGEYDPNCIEPDPEFFIQAFKDRNDAVKLIGYDPLEYNNKSHEISNSNLSDIEIDEKQEELWRKYEILATNNMFLAEILEIELV